MGSVVVDTHAAVWYLLKSPRLSQAAFDAIELASQPGSNVYLPSISMVEVIYLVEKGKISQRALDKMADGISDARSGWIMIPLDLGVIRELEKLLRSAIPDMPDRIIAATALHLNVPLITCDSRIQTAGLSTIW